MTVCQLHLAHAAVYLPDFMSARSMLREHAMLRSVLQAAKDIDSFPLAVSFEAMWHMIFFEPPIVHAVSKCDIFECRYRLTMLCCA